MKFCSKQNYFSSSNRSIHFARLLQNSKYYVTLFRIISTQRSMYPRVDFPSSPCFFFQENRSKCSRFTHRIRGVIRSRIVSIPSGGNRSRVFRETRVKRMHAIDRFLRSFRGNPTRRFGDDWTRFHRETNWLDFNERGIVGRKGVAGPRSEITEERHTHVGRERFLE